MNFKEWLELQEYNEPRKGMKSRWSVKYKKSINCSNPKGFSQANYCKRKARGGKYQEWISENEILEPMLYHTTSVNGLMKILQGKQIVANPFASMSEKCLFHGDIQSADVCFGIVQNKVQPNLMKVMYNPTWFQQHPEHASYVAGEGWKEQFQYEPSNHEEDDQEEYEQQYLEAELEAFLSKKDEREWVTQKEYEPISFQPTDLKVIIPNNPALHQQISRIIEQMPEYQTAQIIIK